MDSNEAKALVAKMMKVKEITAALVGTVADAVKCPSTTTTKEKRLLYIVNSIVTEWALI